MPIPRKGEYGEPVRVNDAGTLMTHDVYCISAIVSDTRLGMERAKEIVERCQQCTNALNARDPEKLAELEAAVKMFFREWDDEESCKGCYEAIEKLRDAARAFGTLGEVQDV